MMNPRYVLITLVALTFMVGLGTAPTASAAPSKEHIDAMLEQPVTLYMVSGERWDGALYKRSDGHVVFKGNDGRIQSFPLRNIARVALYQDPEQDTSRDEHLPDEPHTSAASTTPAEHATTADNTVEDSSVAQKEDSDRTASDAEDDEAASSDKDRTTADASERASNDGTVESMDEEALLEDAEIIEEHEIFERHNAAHRVARNEPIFHALDRYALDEELKALQRKQDLKREVDRTSRGLIIGGATVIGFHTMFQGLLLIPMFTEGGMSSRTAKILSGVNVPFLALGGSLLAAGLVQRRRAQKEFQERYNFSVAPVMYRDGGGAHMRLHF